MTGSTFGSRRGGHVVLLDGLHQDAVAQSLVPTRLAQSEGAHDENWLQDFIHRFPQVLPVTDIEPAFERLIPICRELAVANGFLDNLFATPRGDLVLVECKLWRNPQARREVVAQIIDYAENLARWTYADLDAAIRKARGRNGGDGRGLFQSATSDGQDTPLTEDMFVDAVARNLRLGRFLLLVVGDGIHESVEALAQYLERHAGFHFTMALVEMRLYRTPTNGYVVVPQVVSRTLNLERGIVRIEEGRPRVDPIAPKPAPGTPTPRARSITEEQIEEALAAVDPTLPNRLRTFVERLSDIGVRLEAASRSLVIRWSDDAGRELNIGAVNERGAYLTDYCNWALDGLGRLDISHAYLEDVATIVGGSVRQTPKPTGWYAVLEGTTHPPISMLLDRENDWASAIERFIDAYRST